MREPKPADLTFNIEGGEVLQPQATIELQASRPIDARSAQGAIRLSRGCTRVDVAVELRGRGRVAAVRAEELAPGAYVLTVAELRSFLPARHGTRAIRRSRGLTRYPGERPWKPAARIRSARR